jgi:hypothetical protein
MIYYFIRDNVFTLLDNIEAEELDNFIKHLKLETMQRELFGQIDYETAKAILKAIEEYQDRKSY